MKQLLYYLRTYWHDHFNAKYFAVLAVFLSVSIWYNYKVDFENTTLDSFLHTWQHIPASFAFYAVPYFFAVFAYAVCYRRYGFLRNSGFWATSLFAMLVMANNESFYWQNIYLQQAVSSDIYYFVRKVTNNLVGSSVLFIPVIIYWRLFDCKQQPLYGFNARQINLTPYFAMMLIMLPLISWASFQPDFLRMYPTYRLDQDYSNQQAAHFWIYEIFYGLDFVSVEFFFRGFMVLALAKYLGAGAIMPMVCVYAYMHFGKPMGETIGSVFGGAILGVLAYYSRSIYGGIIIHVGVAWLMELTAFLQTWFKADEGI